MKPAAVDFRILALAVQVTESSDQDVPVLLLKLKEILNSTSLGSKESQKIKQDLYYYNLVQYCMLVLKQDYSRLPGGWATAAQLSEILSQCCVGLEVKEDPEEFYNKLLPSSVDNLLFLGRRLQARFIRAIKDEEKSEFLRCFRTVTDAICWLFGGHIQLTECVLQSNHFLQLLITDDVETATAMISVLQNILRANSSVLLHVDEKILHSVLDELVYKLSSTTNPVTGNAATKVLLSVAESHPQLVELLSTRYRGLRTLLSKQWAGKGFDRNLNQLSDLLYSESCRKGEMQRLHQAACLIQAVWRGFQTRKRLKTLPIAVTALQRSFRAKRKQELQHLKRLKEDETLRQQLQLQRQRAMRLFHERQLTLLEIVHAGQVDRYIQEMEGKAALTIQRHWRGYRARRKVHQQRQSLKQHKAAVIIQRAARKFLGKCQRKRKALSPWKEPKELTGAQKLALQQKVDDYIRLHPASQMPEEMSKELHLQAQEKLAQYLLRSSLDRRAEQRREALLAQVNTDVELLMSAPSLMEATEKDLDVFMSWSVPVACKARQSHNTMLKYTRWPWWKKLGDEVMDDDMIPDDVLNTEFGTLFIGGSKSS
ncbi:IQ calmodulin-binding motif-containing protein 1 isoform X1 [Gopherus evgoodei]|uniref:IQ motif containing B1 n=1 Tax=Gopherus evgoodei TaxID=1825980 RepID=A0A8C4W0V1_9SAUR|nr:IQ calmodulin-binding motif-containing protein 1 isoform X1 [Gopherus evgoodei]XP_030436013.1 IQ calmodulin-binding motif-containing protein 1 isoform X1 [Gopherus evgoodei]XP_030436015.1 IQ calmodulin-binding motif-containing protein 1 isoform X1 [Gopherus evgoodei]XP_030436016.1 IQ calmodulin-binding motif-containing protein 1 isoform X1 [Gopherus evgoodei]XP_030436017.1 IQ calmodulin-binding motif-containing protein 1 isoform X1 [Gopherus evgoodei]XP_030436018.1 IQ calmodulin-binding mot